MSGGIDIAISFPFATDPAEWQSECAWFNQHDSSHTKPEAELETMRSDKVAAINELITRRIR